MQVTPQSPEFIPSSARVNSSPNFHNGNNGHIVKPSFVNPLKGMTIGGGNNHAGGNGKRSMLRNCSPESLTDSPTRLTPQSSPPTNALNTAQMLQENVGGTTYFYPAADPSAAMGTDGGGAGSGGGADLYQMPVHMYPGTPRAALIPCHSL